MDLTLFSRPLWQSSMKFFVWKLGTRLFSPSHSLLIFCWISEGGRGPLDVLNVGSFCGPVWCCWLAPVFKSGEKSALNNSIIDFTSLTCFESSPYPAYHRVCRFNSFFILFSKVRSSDVIIPRSLRHVCRVMTRPVSLLYSCVSWFLRSFHSRVDEFSLRWTSCCFRRPNS